MAFTVLKSINTDLTTAIELTMGDYVDSVASLTTPATLNIMTATPGFAPQPAGFNRLLKEMQIMGSPTAILVGGDKLMDYHNMRSFANPNTAAYNNNYDPVKYFIDHGIDTALGAGEAISWAPGAVQLVTNNINRNKELFTDNPLVSRDVVNIFGHDFDLDVKTDCDNYVLTLNLRYTEFYIPDAYYTACNVWNEKQKYLLGCGAITC